MGWSIEEFAAFCKRLKVDPGEALASGYIDLTQKGHHGLPSAKKGHETNITRSRLRPPVSQRDAPVALVEAKGGKDQGALCADQRPLVRIFIARTYACDQDNLVGGAKALIDCLCESGLVPEDSPAAIRLEITQAKARSRQAQGTTVVIDYP
jgi:hypothetical protein